MLIGDAIKQARQKAQMGQAELAAALDVSVPTISDWENHKKRPHPDRWQRLAEVLSFNPDEVFNKENLRESISYIPPELVPRVRPQKHGVFNSNFKEVIQDIGNRQNLHYRLMWDLVEYSEYLVDLLRKDPSYKDNIYVEMVNRTAGTIRYVLRKGMDEDLNLTPDDIPDG